MTPKEQDQRLAEIRTRCKKAMGTWAVNPPYSPYEEYLVGYDLSWLVELVDERDNFIYEAGVKIGELQEQVRELEADIAQCRDNYDGNHE